MKKLLLILLLVSSFAKAQQVKPLIFDWWANSTPAIVRPSTVLTSDAVASQEGTFTLTITFSQTVTNFVVGDITCSYCFATNLVSTGNPVFTATITPQGVSENMSINVADGVADHSGSLNIASNTLSLSQWNPVANIGSSVYMEQNFRHTLGKTLSGFENSILGNSTAEGSGAMAWNSVAAMLNTVDVVPGGDWAYFPGQQGYESTDKTGTRFLHDATTSWYLFARVFLDGSSTASILHVWNSNDASSANRGMNARIDVTSGNVATLNFNVTNGGSSLVINQSAIALATVPAGGAWYTLQISKSGSGSSIGSATYTVLWNGVSKFSGTNTSAITGTADSGFNPTIGKKNNSLTFSSNALLKDILLVNGTLTGGQVTSITNYLALGRETIGSGVTRYLFLFAGQSLVDGNPQSQTPDATIQGALDGYIFVPTFSATYANTNTFAVLQYGVNQGYNSTTYYGPNLSFVKAASAALPNKKIYVSQVAVGGTPWYNQSGSNNCWSTANGASLARNSITFQWIQQALRIHRYQLNSTIIPMLYMFEGQTDCQSTNPDAVGATQNDKNLAVQASVKTNMTNYIKKLIDDFQTAGFNTSGLVMQFSRIKSTYNPSTPNYTTYVNNAIDDVVANFATDNPTYVGKYRVIFSQNTDYMNISGDGTHPNDASQKLHGEIIHTNFLPYY